MIFTELFETKDVCPVCGQTPCNCTGVSEDLSRRGFLKGAGAAAVAGATGSALASEKKFEDYITDALDKEKYLNQKKRAERVWALSTTNSMLRAAAIEERVKLRGLKNELAKKYNINDNVNEQGVAEARVGNRMSDIQIGSPKIVYYKGKAVGEVGLDHEASPGNGPFYMKHYLTGKDMVGYDTKKEALADLKHLVMQMSEDTLNEFAPSGDGGNGPFDYGSAIVKIGEDFVDHYQDSGAGEDAADIMEVGKTFMSDGMPAGIAALFALDTEVYDHVLQALADEGFNVRADIISKKQKPKSVGRSTANWFAQQQANVNAQPGEVYLVTGHHAFGQLGKQVKALSPEEAKQKFIAANPKTKFINIDVKPAQGVAEGKPEKPERPEADYGDDYQAMVSRVKKLAGLGPLKTVYDPNKRVYKNVPTAVQPGNKK